jgi:hypothetical protein
MGTYTVISEFLTYGFNPRIVSVRVEPVGLTMAVGDIQQFTATAVWSDGTETDVTASSWWWSNDYYGGPNDTMLFDNYTYPRGLGTALDLSTPGYVNASYYDNLWSQEFTGSVTVDITGTGPVVMSGLDSLQISGSSTFDIDSWGAGGFGAPEYLEAYPMRRDTSTVPWTAYNVVSGTNPNPPRTGYGTFNYNNGDFSVTVSNTTPRFWQGTYAESPWFGVRYAMDNGSPYQWLTNGYAGSTYSGLSTANGSWMVADPISYIWPYDNPVSAWTVGNVYHTSLTPNVNWYAQTLLQGSVNTYGVDMNFGYPRVIHFIGYGPEWVYDFTLVTSVLLHTNMNVTNKWGAEPLPFKALSANEALVWLPSGFSYPQYYPDGQGGTYNWVQMNFEFDDSLGNWYTLNSEFDIFTGV